MVSRMHFCSHLGRVLHNGGCNSGVNSGVSLNHSLAHVSARWHRDITSIIASVCAGFITAMHHDAHWRKTAPPGLKIPGWAQRGESLSGGQVGMCCWQQMARGCVLGGPPHSSAWLSDQTGFTSDCHGQPITLTQNISSAAAAPGWAAGRLQGMGKGLL